MRYVHVNSGERFRLPRALTSYIQMYIST